MKINCILKHTQRAVADALVLPFYKDTKGAVKPAFAEKNLVKWAKEPIELKDFEGKIGEIFLTYSDKGKEKRVILLGLGDSKKVTTESLRRSYAKLTQYCQAHRIRKINLFTPALKQILLEELVQGICEGVLLSNYIFDRLKSVKDSKTILLTHCCLIGLAKDKQAWIDKWKNISEGVCLARDLVNDNADTIHAQALSESALNLAAQFDKIKTIILDKKKLEEENLNLILTVNRGAEVDPALIVLQYTGNSKNEESTIIVGKGVTYDTGGLQLKPRDGTIIHMKSDMSGAAAVLGTVYAAAKLDLKLNIIGLIPACENAIDGKSYKPGDVYKSHNGKTVEIISTDAEGRLVLADAMSYAQKKFKSNHLIDIATLTGGVIAALGNKVSGLMSNRPALAKKLKIASERSGENVWELPLIEDYKEALKSSIADLRNATREPGYAAAIIAGLFLQEFVQSSTSWAHLDIAGTAYLSDPQFYQRTKGTGVGVRLMIAFLEDLLNS